MGPIHYLHTIKYTELSMFETVLTTLGLLLLMEGMGPAFFQTNGAAILRKYPKNTRITCAFWES